MSNYFRWKYDSLKSQPRLKIVFSFLPRCAELTVSNSSFWILCIKFQPGIPHCLLIYLFKLNVFSGQLSSHHGSPLRRLGQGQTYYHLQSVPLRAEGFPQLLLKGNPKRVETFHSLLLQSCPTWVFLHCYIMYQLFTYKSIKMIWFIY